MYFATLGNQLCTLPYIYNHPTIIEKIVKKIKSTLCPLELIDLPGNQNTRKLTNVLSWLSPLYPNCKAKNIVRKPRSRRHMDDY